MPAKKCLLGPVSRSCLGYWAAIHPGSRGKRAMKRLILVVLFISGLALGQDKPRVFVQGKGSEDMTTSGSGGGGRHWGAWGSKSTVDWQCESMEAPRICGKTAPAWWPRSIRTTPTIPSG